MKKTLFFVIFFISCFGFSQDLTMQNGSFNRCAPDRLFDSGGESGNYSNNEDIVTTLCSVNAGELIILDFIPFSTQEGQDVLTIYDGTDTTAPIIGTFSGTTSPGRVEATASNTSGCLTLRFTTNGSGNTTGFAADIICAAPCQTIVASIDTTNPAQNGSGFVEVFPGDTVDFSGSATFSGNGTGATYDWDFGDGNSASGTDVSNTFNQPGNYTVTFTVQDDNPLGCEDSVTIDVVVLPALVTVNNSAYPQSELSLEELVDQVLVTGGCSAVENFSVQVNGSPGNTNNKSYGYFTNGGATNFPFEEGIVLTTGVAFQGGNQVITPIVSNLNGQPGDNDLEMALGQNNTNDATFVKFNFTPTVNRISFRYIMASEEYNQRDECNFSDSFAFLLREAGTTAYTNLAVLPDGTPVSITNINAFANCPANQMFFEGYNIGETNYGGRTIVLTATADVIPNTTYEIKLVVADQGDSAFDSAIFLEAGSFNLGGDLGEDLTIDAGTADCDGNQVTLDTGASTATHTWFYAADPNMPNDTVEIMGETTSTLDVDQPGIYYVDVEFGTGCSTSDSILVEFRESPVANPAQDLILCDTDGNMEFDLSENNDDILGGQDPADYEISYHLTEQNAIDNAGALPLNYVDTNTTTQTIWARIASTDQLCFDITSFQIEYNALSVNDSLDPLENCDNSANNGFTEFMLTDRDDEVIGTNDPADVNVTYHDSFDNANDDMSPLASPYLNVVPNMEQVFVRLELVANPSCYFITTLDLIVLENPTANDATLSLCNANVESANDEFTEFNLTDREIDITGGATGIVVTYYERDADAQALTNEIDDPTAYTNQSVDGLPANPQTIYVVVRDILTDCISFTTLELEVLDTPNPTQSDNITPIERCDINNPGDGIEVFDLTENETLILNGETDITVTYHETPEGADSGNGEMIADPTQFSNVSTPEDIVYVRVTNNVSDCYVVVNFIIRVNPLPSIEPISDLLSCEVNTDGIDSFDLTVKDAEVLNGQDPSLYQVSYHSTLSDAQNLNAPLASPYTNQSNPQLIYVAITNTDTGCSASGESFNIGVEEAAVANPDMVPIVYELCDDNMEIDGDPTNDSVQFDLSTLDPEVLDGQDPTGYIVSYYTTQEAADIGTDPIPFIYENVSNTQTIYARVDNDNLVVVAISLDISALSTALDLNIDGNLDIFDTNGDDIFDLLDVNGDGLSDGIDTNADGIFEFVDVNGDGLGDPVDLNNDGTFDNLSDEFICYDTTSLILQVNPLPNFNLEDNYTLCLNTNGTEILDPLVIDTELSVADYIFEWFFNSTLLPEETGGAIMPNQGGMYQVIVTDRTTLCVNDLDVGITQVSESEPPILEVNLTTQAFEGKNVIEATATGFGDYEFSLDGGPWQDEGTFTNVSPGIRTITARDKNGCGIATEEVLVIDYPLYFTPNGDGTNDTWNIVGISTQPNAKIYIFDRYGKLLKELSPTGNGWDGTFNGNPLPTSDYWFRVTYNEPLTGQRKEFNAHFTLKR
ncbi:choice-of-anchor L domain-containing protein [Winogradskyella ursingii]|uniref:choice-of-anchor L domain-containing protein n=1 Tax=Winogradskyella ursingii TaxID=2686079 RepID=UPI001FE73753|nr:choice-of-anchor L domain-containing protein [Winogradskyella ursingii]